MEFKQGKLAKKDQGTSLVHLGAYALELSPTKQPTFCVPSPIIRLVIQGQALAYEMSIHGFATPARGECELANSCNPCLTFASYQPSRLQSKRKALTVKETKTYSSTSEGHEGKEASALDGDKWIGCQAVQSRPLQLLRYTSR
eukprot:1161836-Pelagomonas_calceolata.AAC.7